MITQRPAKQRGHTNLGWLDSWHTFSFGDYYDPDHMGFRTLRVINDDIVEPGKGFGTHPHRDMEIVTWVLDGALEHKDSMGNGSVIRPGELQRMTAGTGVTHSEFNPSRIERARLLQIWILPERDGLEPGYEQRTYDPRPAGGALRLVAAQGGRDGALTIHQDASVYIASLEPGEAVSHPLAAGRHGWVQVATGAVTLNGVRLEEGDGAAVSKEAKLDLRAEMPSDLIVFDLS